MQRRHFLALSLGALAPGSILSSAVNALDFRADPPQVLGNLEKAVWLSTKKGASQTAYVIAAPWCVYTQRFYLAQKQALHDIDFRFVFLSLQKYSAAIANAYLSEDADQVGVFYADPNARFSPILRGPAKWIDDINFVTIQKMSNSVRGIVTERPGVKSNGTSGVSVPTLVQRMGSGQIRGIVSGADIITTIIDDNALPSTSAANAARSPAYANFIQQTRPPKRAADTYFVQVPQANCYAAPLADAPLVDVIAKGYGLKGSVEQIAGEDWVALQAFQKFDARIWGRLSDFA